LTVFYLFLLLKAIFNSSLSLSFSALAFFSDSLWIISTQSVTFFDNMDEIAYLPFAPSWFTELGQLYIFIIFN